MTKKIKITTTTSTSRKHLFKITIKTTSESGATREIELDNIVKYHLLGKCLLITQFEKDSNNNTTEYVNKFINFNSSDVGISTELDRGYAKSMLFKYKNNDFVAILSEPVRNLRKRENKKVFIIRNNEASLVENNEHTGNKQGQLEEKDGYHLIATDSGTILYNVRKSKKDKKELTLRIQKNNENWHKVKTFKMPVESKKVLLTLQNNPRSGTHFNIIQLLKKNNDVFLKKGTLVFDENNVRYQKETEKELKINRERLSDNDKVFFKYNKKIDDYVVKIKKENPLISAETMPNLTQLIKRMDENAPKCNYLVLKESDNSKKDTSKINTGLARDPKSSIERQVDATTPTTKLAQKPRMAHRNRRDIPISTGNIAEPMSSESLMGSGFIVPKPIFQQSSMANRSNFISRFFESHLNNTTMLARLFFKDKNKTSRDGILLEQKTQQNIDAYNFAKNNDLMRKLFHLNNPEGNTKEEEKKKETHQETTSVNELDTKKSTTSSTHELFTKATKTIKDFTKATTTAAKTTKDLVGNVIKDTIKTTTNIAKILVENFFANLINHTIINPTTNFDSGYGGSEVLEDEKKDGMTLDKPKKDSSTTTILTDTVNEPMPIKKEIQQIL